VKIHKPLMLIILDGWGWRENGADNAIVHAKTPVWHALLRDYPHALLQASGEAVGLPAGVIGNSEVGHMNIGAGRVVYQDLSRIDLSIRDGSFFKNPTLQSIFKKIQDTDGTLHLMGLLSDAGVHSHINHLFALLDAAKRFGFQKISVHCFMDGRDSSPHAGEKYLEQLENKLKSIPGASIGSIIGRYYAMDRDHRWDRTERALCALITPSPHGDCVTIPSPLRGEGQGEGGESLKAIQASYSKGITDEFVEPVILGRTIQNGDGVIFFNFRADRTRQLTQKLAIDEGAPALSGYVTMTQYHKSYPFPVLFPEDRPTYVLGEAFCEHGLRQFRIAESEKYAHVTYFINGGREVKFDKEDRLLIQSPRDVATYDQKPEMSADAVTDEVVKIIRARKHDIIILNFANADMVGHSGDIKATMRACEAVDRNLGRILPALRDVGGTAVITADHGNAEVMLDENGKPHTAHTLNPVPFFVIPPVKEDLSLRSGGKLCDIAPTILKLLGITPPKEMTGTPLL